jgi:hypothetical protein
MWTCPKCGHKVDPSFEVCWNCGTTQDGVEDPNFVPADEAGPIELPPAELPEGPDELAAAPLPSEEIVEAYLARNVHEARFVANLLEEEGMPAVSDETNLRPLESFLGLVPLGPYFGARVWVRASDLARAHTVCAEYDQKHKAHFEPGIAD